MEEGREKEREGGVEGEEGREKGRYREHKERRKSQWRTLIQRTIEIHTQELGGERD